MESIVIRYTDHPKLEDPIFVEGLPGIGNVGKLAAEHLKDELKAVKFAEIFSKYFPPQVLVQEDGQVKLVNNEMHYVKRGNGKDLLLLTGDYQGLTPEGQYELSDFILREIRKFGVRRVFTLGGYGMGRMVTKPRVLGAATHASLVKEMEKHGVVFSRGEPGAGIVGASGLLLGLGRMYDMQAVCLMGETSGYFVDPKSAQAVLEVLTKVLDVEISFSELENKAKQIDQITSKLRDIEAAPEPPDKREDLGYIG
ncbi:MAG: proteasome assembly chaperone family protein [Methanobacteriota archaeon]